MVFEDHSCLGLDASSPMDTSEALHCGDTTQLGPPFNPVHRGGTVLEPVVSLIYFILMISQEKIRHTQNYLQKI